MTRQVHYHVFGDVLPRAPRHVVQNGRSQVQTSLRASRKIAPFLQAAAKEKHGALFASRARCASGWINLLQTM